VLRPANGSPPFSPRLPRRPRPPRRNPERLNDHDRRTFHIAASGSFHEPILVATFAVVVIGGLGVLGLITRYKLWGYLWKEWFTTVDHKKIGIMYMILGLIMFLRGFADAVMMRLQQAMAFGGSEGYLNAHHYDQIFTAHGVIMIFFVAMPLITGLMNYLVPLQIGARDVSFPFLNNFSFWMTTMGAVLVMASLFIGEFARTGWLAYPPLSGIGYSPGVGVDYYIWALQIVNLIWIWGHPEVYILILPLFGVFSEVTSTFSGKKLFGYTSMVYATVVITILSYLVWLHHFFTMGSGASVNSFFGITTMIISIPTGAKLFNWLFTMYRGRIRFELPMMWTVAFMLTFVIGGMTGVMLAVPPADFVLHNSLFLIAHFHNVIIGGVLFGLFAAINFWWPKAFGFRLEKKWGLVSFWCWVVGFWMAFMPLYVLGFMGVTRRMRVFDDPAYQIWFVIAGVGVAVIAVGILAMLIQFAVSIIHRDKLRDETGDPWLGRTLEWATSSPPPDYNFAKTPIIHDSDAWWDMKTRGYERPTEGFKPIHMPANTGAGFILSALSLIVGFALIWYIWWLAAAGFAALIAYAIFHTFNYRRDYYIPAETVQATEDARTQALTAAAATQG